MSDPNEIVYLYCLSSESNEWVDTKENNHLVSFLLNNGKTIKIHKDDGYKRINKHNHVFLQSTTKLECAHCSHLRRRPVNTIFICSTCKVPLCVTKCWNSYKGHQ